MRNLLMLTALTLYSLGAEGKAMDLSNFTCADLRRWCDWGDPNGRSAGCNILLYAQKNNRSLANQAKTKCDTVGPDIGGCTEGCKILEGKACKGACAC